MSVLLAISAAYLLAGTGLFLSLRPLRAWHRVAWHRLTGRWPHGKPWPPDRFPLLTDDERRELAGIGERLAQGADAPEPDYDRGPR